jgi:serralysin
MMYDIAALQHLYGPNYTTNSGDSVYGWSPSTGEMFINGAGQGAPGANRIFMTVWDGGGTDTYDLSNYGSALTIDLRPGQWTTTSPAQLAKLHFNGSQIAVGNIANALLHAGSWLAIIENAKGGWGPDTIIGNQAPNTLWGNAGNDALFGGNSNDMLFGGLGADYLVGGNGFDLAGYGDATSGLIADLRYIGVNNGEAFGDSYISIEGVAGSAFADSLRGDDLDNLIYGQNGGDALYGRGGNDALVGGVGADILDGGPGIDAASYGTAAAGVVADLRYPGVNTGEAAGDIYVSIERLYGSPFADSLRGDNLANLIFGAAGDDLIYGRGGNDTLAGGDGNDVLMGGYGADLLVGGDGLDLASYGTAISALIADLRYIGVNNGEASGDSYVSIEGLVGSAFADSLRGDDLGNLIHGGGGDDALYGRGGNDTLIGEAGADLLYGGAGADRFLFNCAADSSPSARDTIMDFLRGVDTIDLRPIDADTSLNGDQPFDYIGGGGFTGTAGELRFLSGFLSGDTNGDGAADFQVYLVDVETLFASDFFF